MMGLLRVFKNNLIFTVAVEMEHATFELSLCRLCNGGTIFVVRMQLNIGVIKTFNDRWQGGTYGVSSSFRCFQWFQ